MTVVLLAWNNGYSCYFIISFECHEIIASVSVVVLFLFPAGTYHEIIASVSVVVLFLFPTGTYHEIIASVSVVVLFLFPTGTYHEIIASVSCSTLKKISFHHRDMS